MKVDDLRASMVMGQPFPGVWLPKTVGIHAGVTLALGFHGIAVQARILELPQGRRLVEGHGSRKESAVRE